MTCDDARKDAFCPRVFICTLHAAWGQALRQVLRTLLPLRVRVIPHTDVVEIGREMSHARADAGDICLVRIGSVTRPGPYCVTLIMELRGRGRFWEGRFVAITENDRMRCEVESTDIFGMKASEPGADMRSPFGTTPGHVCLAEPINLVALLKELRPFEGLSREGWDSRLAQSGLGSRIPGLWRRTRDAVLRRNEAAALDEGRQFLAEFRRIDFQVILLRHHNIWKRACSVLERPMPERLHEVEGTLLDAEIVLRAMRVLGNEE